MELREILKAPLPQLYLCPKCNQPLSPGEIRTDANGYIIPCRSCAIQRADRKYMALCPPLYQQSDEARLTKLPEVMAWKSTPDKPGLLMIGPTGRGKTRCAWILLRRLMCEDLLEVQAFDCVRFGHEIGRRYREETAEDWLDELAACPLVFFDDFGKLKFTERAETELFGLIERRTARQLPIIATSNDTGDSLTERMTGNRGPAMIRRLRDFCHVIQF